MPVAVMANYDNVILNKQLNSRNFSVALPTLREINLGVETITLKLRQIYQDLYSLNNERTLQNLLLPRLDGL